MASGLVSDSLAATRRADHRLHPPLSPLRRLAVRSVLFTVSLLQLLLLVDAADVLEPNTTMPSTVTPTPTTATPTTPMPTATADDLLNSTTNNTAALLSGSDLSAIFYLHYSNGVIVPPLPFTNSSVTLPTAVRDRLETLQLEFHQLDGLLQRALLWDAGYIYNPLPPTNSRRRRLTSSSASNELDADKNDQEENRIFPFLRVYTRNGVDMAHIAPTRSDMESSGCALQLCSSEFYGTTWRAVACTDSSAILNAVQCAIDLVDDETQVVDGVSADGRPRTVWTAFNMEDRERIPNNSEIATPDVNVAASDWSDIESRQSFGSASSNNAVRIYSIHTIPFSEEPPIGQCPANRTDEEGSLLPTWTIPCASYASIVGGVGNRRLQATNASLWRQPTASKLVSSWLQTVAPASSPTKGPTPGTKPSGTSGRPGPDSNDDSDGPPQNDGPLSPVNGHNANGFDILNLVPIVVGVLVAVAIVFGFVLLRRRRISKPFADDNNDDVRCSPYDRSSMMKTEDGYLYGAYLSPVANTVAATYLSGRSADDNLVFEIDDQHSTFPTSGSGSGGLTLASTKPTRTDLDPVVRNNSLDKKTRGSSRGLIGMPSLRRHTSEPASTGSLVSRPSLDSEHLKLLQTDPNLSASRISYDKIVFEKVVSQSARYEVWLCQYEGEELAVKRLVADKSEDEDHTNNLILEAFVAEIQITAALDHPNIAKFVGVAWARLPADSLCLVMEYASNGELGQYLLRHRAELTWPQHKRQWAMGVASALEYLHAQRPVVLHLAVNSTHIQLSDRLQPMLIDFGERLSPEDWTQLRISSGRSPQVQFPYWAAPEVLRGDGHLMASDVYSFGMLLVELDQCAVPFQHARNSSNGEDLKPFQLMNMVISGRLKPSVSGSCPEMIRELVDRCTDAVPGRRPTMSEVLRTLELVDYE